MTADHVALLAPQIVARRAGYHVHYPDSGERFIPHFVAYAPVPNRPGDEQAGAVVPATTTATFAAAAPGVYRWFCALPCDDKARGWDMTQGFGSPSQDGYMAGNIVVIA